ncbi:MAG: CNNM domain-containing protein, partial [Oscillospiraceae bacterium]
MVNLVIIIILLVISAFFSASEMAFSTVNRIRLKNYAIQGDKRAKKALEIAESFDKALTTILVGNNVVNIASASLATVAFTQLFGDGAVGVATVIMTVAVLIFGEIIPKSLAKENAEKLALSFAGILLFLIKILTPITFIFSKIKSLVSKLFKGESQPSVTEDELKYIIEEIENEGVLEEQESNLVRSALEFDEIQVNQILVPRVNVVSINCKESIENIKNIFVTEMYS